MAADEPCPLSSSVLQALAGRQGGGVYWGSQVCIEILWRPITASPSPVVARRLRIAARAFTCFLRTLLSELPACFLVLNLNDMGGWINKLGDWSVAVIGEADCKEQFNNVRLQVVIQHMREAAQWLRKRRNEATTLGWSIHKDNKKLDRAGAGPSVHKRPTYTVYGHAKKPSPSCAVWVTSL